MLTIDLKFAFLKSLKTRYNSLNRRYIDADHLVLVPNTLAFTYNIRNGRGN